MENIKAEVNEKIRSAIKAKLMELGVYVDEELPDYIMVMVVNKRTKAQMEDDLQLFLGSNTEHFTIWLHQVLQKLEEVTGLDKKGMKNSTSTDAETSERKRKTSTGSLDSDSHRKEKRRKSHEGKKSKKTEQKKDADSSNSVEVEKNSKPSAEGSSQNKEPVVSSSVDINSGSKASAPEVKKTASVKTGVVSSSSVDDTRTLPSEANTEVIGVGGIEDTKITSASKVSSTLSQELADQAETKAKVALMHSDDEEDDDEDFINIKADAEAEALLNEELPKESSVVSSDALISPVADHSSVAEKTLVTEEAKKTESIDSEPENLEIPVGTFDRKRLSPKDTSDPQPSIVPLSEKFARKRKLDKELEVEDRLPTPPNRLVTTTLSIKDRLGIKKPEPAVRVQDRLGVRTVPVEPLKKRKAELVAMTSNTRNSSQTIEKTVRDRISRRMLEGTGGYMGDGNQERKRPILSRVVLPQPGREEEEYDPANPAVGTVASVVRVKPRPRLPAELQANKNLLLKAVAEAQKSVANIPIRPELISSSRKNISESMLARRARAANIAITLPNRRGQSLFDSQRRDPESERMVMPGLHSREKITIQVSTNSILTNSSMTRIGINNKKAELSLHVEQDLGVVEDDDDMLPDEGIVTEELDNEDEVPAIYPPVGLASRMPRESKPQPLRSESPQFLVTLDGLDPSMFPSHSNSVDEDQCSPGKAEEEDEQDDVSSKTSSSTPSPPSKEKISKSPIVFTKKDTSTETEGNLPKSLERCKYWPSCRLGTKCAFHHPNTPCKSFPKCPFREKCLYIHPMCKFDSGCTRRDCPFMHMAFAAHPSPLTSASRLKLKTAGPSHVSSQVCKYFPKCTNALCQFLHPKPCRYGKFCSKPNCNYLHDELPPVDKLKWTSPFRT